MHPKPRVHERFWHFVALNEIDNIQIYQASNGRIWIYGRKRIGMVPGGAWGTNKIIFKTKSPIGLEEAMEEIIAGVKTPDIYFRKNYPIKRVP